MNGANASTGTLTLQMYFPGAVVTGNWLSGGSSTRYPAGNRYEVPFEVRVPRPGDQVTASTGEGANLRLLLAVVENVQRGLMIDLPNAPRSVRVIF
jgi:hypothetical protein